MMPKKPLTYEEARNAAENAVFDWYTIEQAWHDELPAEALEALHEVIARALMQASQEMQEKE